MSNLPPDPWRVLGVEKNADKTEIRTAYRKLVLKCHPDKVQDPTLKALKQDEFQKVQQAYELLNDDTERAKYEEQLKLAELRKLAQHAIQKNMANSSASRTPPRSSPQFVYEVHDVGPRTKYASPHHASPMSSGGKVYANPYASTKSYEDDMDHRSQTLYEDGERRARRSNSYEMPSRRDEEKREERKRRERREEEDRERERERDRREKEARKTERKQRDKERDKEKRRDVEEKSRRHKPSTPYVEQYPEDDGREVYPTSTKVEKTKASPLSSSRKSDEPRAKSSSRRERGESPRVAPAVPPPPVEKEKMLRDFAASYIESHRAKAPAPAPATASTPRGVPTLERAHTFQADTVPYYATVPTPPLPAAVEYEDEGDVRRSMARSSHRRASNDLPVRSRERPYISSHKKSREAIAVVDASPRPPTLQKASTMPPPAAPESPPRYPRPQRVNTAPQGDIYSRPPPVQPSFVRAPTWQAGDGHNRLETMVGTVEESEEEDRYEESRRRRTRRTRSPEPLPDVVREPVRQTSYKVGSGYKTTKVVDPAYEPYDEPPRHSRKHGGSYDRVDDHRDAYYAAPTFSRVKQSKSIRPEDVSYSDIRYPPAQQDWAVTA